MRHRGVKYDTVHVGAGRIQRGLPQDVKALIAYFAAYTEFLERMSEDPRFVCFYGDERGM